MPYSFANNLTFKYSTMKNFKNILGNFAHKSKLTKEDSANQAYEHQHGEHSQPTRYYCPMKCEGNKVYDAPGNCPVCNMKLVPVSDEKHHSH
jgi:hypothetical protein